jgi:16S rRNA G1207 methylase RsmC
MNPPFRRGTDVAHITKALGHLKPGGRIVSLCYNGSAQNKALKPLATTWEVLKAGTFKESGTMAEVVMLSIFT